MTAHTRYGFLLYTALPFSFLLGTYRLLNFKNFHREIGTGLAIDFFLNCLAMLIIQSLNNTYMNTEAAEADVTYKFSGL